MCKYRSILAMFIGLGLCVTPAYANGDGKALNLSRAWQNNPASVSRGEDGKIIYRYGQAQPVVICSPLNVCDVELQAGETVSDVMIGDTVRWKVKPATSGSGEQQAVHMIIKPTEPDLETSMVVTTSLRTYHFRLISTERDYMARIGFSYPDTIDNDLVIIRQRMAQQATAKLPGTHVPAENLDFRYYMRGSAPWKPVRVYHDGTRTYIQFPRNFGGGPAPILFVMAQGQQQIVNYRLRQNALMVVDLVVHEAVLMAGTGRSQNKVHIHRGGM